MVQTLITRSEYLQESPCPLCEGTVFKVIYPSSYPPKFTRDDLAKMYRSSADEKLMDPLVQCRSCNFLFLNPRPKDDIISEAYADAVDPTFFSQNPSRIKTFQRVFSSILNRLEVKPDKSQTVLDIGCAGGAFPKAAHNLGFSVVGIEPSEWLVEKGRKEYNLDLRPGFLSDNQFPDKRFDFVTLWDVFEHLTDPKKMLQQVYRILKDDGVFIINYPDYDSMARKVLGKKWPFFLSVHLSYFTPSTIKPFLRKNGFETIYIKPHFQSLELAYVLARAEKIFPVIKPLRWLIQKSGLGRVPLMYNVGQSLLVARKI